MEGISKLKDEDFYIDFSKAALFSGKEKIQEIKSAQRLKILYYFSHNPGIWLSKDQILENCWKEDARVEGRTDSTVESTICRLRKLHDKISESINPKRDFGYMYLGQELEGGEPTKTDESDIPQSVDPAKLAEHLVILGGKKPSAMTKEELLSCLQDIASELERGLCEDFFAVSAAAWKEFGKTDKARMIFRVFLWYLELAESEKELSNGNSRIQI